MSKLALTVNNECLLKGAPPALVARLKKKLTLPNPKYSDAVRYSRWVGKNLPKKLYFFTTKGSDLAFPRGYARHALDLCHEHGLSPEIIDQRLQLDPIPLTFHGKLRPYQKTATMAMLKRDFGVLQAATGSGKTIMATSMIASRQQPALILVHTRELLHQWHQQLSQFLRLEAGLIGDGHYQPGPVTVGLIHSVRKHLNDLPARFGHIVIDEAHRTPSSMFTEIIRQFHCRYMLGLTATPFRRDGLTEIIHWYTGDLVHLISQKELNRQGAVLKPEIIKQPTSFKFRYRGDYQKLLKALTSDEDRNEMIADNVADEIKNNGGTALVVSDRVGHCLTLLGLLEKRGLNVGLLTGGVAKENRERIVHQVQENELDGLISTIQLIGEGFDCAGLSSLFMATPIKFSGRLTQVLGRILRPQKDKTARVYDYLDPVKVLEKSSRARQQFYQDNYSESDDKIRD